MSRTFDPIVVTAVAGGAGAGALIDVWTRRLPNGLTFGIATLGLVLAAAQRGGLGLAEAAAGFGLGLLLMLPGHLVGATGAGDVKLFAAMGTLLGIGGVVVAFFYTAIAGGVVALIVAAQRRRLQSTMERTVALVATGGANVAEIEHAAADNRFAYAPAIALGTLVAALGF